MRLDLRFETQDGAGASMFLPGIGGEAVPFKGFQTLIPAVEISSPANTSLAFPWLLSLLSEVSFGFPSDDIAAV